MRLELIAAREAKGWSQEQLAKKIGKVDRSSISHYERGSCDIPGRVLHQLAVLLDTPMDVLLKIHDPADEPAMACGHEGVSHDPS